MDQAVSVHFQELVLQKLLSFPENKYCADCRFQSPDWVSITYGVLICYKCSGVHRSLGVQNTRVKSTTLDTWTLRQLFFMSLLNNEKANEYWEAKRFGHSVSLASASAIDLTEFIRSKYITRAFVNPEKESPMTEANNKLEADISSEDKLYPEELFKRKQGELQKLLKLRSMTALGKGKDTDKTPIITRKIERSCTSVVKNFAQTPSPVVNKKFTFNFQDLRSAEGASGHTNTPADSSFPLFEGLNIKSKDSICSIRESLPEECPKLSPFRLSVPLEDQDTKVSSTVLENHKEPFIGFRFSGIPSCELDTKSTENHCEDNFDNQLRAMGKVNFGRCFSADAELISETPRFNTSYVENFENFREVPVMEYIEEKEDMSSKTVSQLNIEVPRSLSSRSPKPEDIENHESITKTLLEAKKQFTHLKRPSEDFQCSKSLEGAKIITFLGRKSGRCTKFFVVIGCFILHVLMGYLYIWGAISPYIGSLLDKQDIYNIDYFQIASYNAFLFLGMAFGYPFSERFVNIFGMRTMSLVCFMCIGSLMFLSSVMVASFIQIILLTLLTGLFMGLAYQIPFFCAIQYFQHPNILKSFFYITNGIGALFFTNLYPFLLWELDSFEELDNDPMKQGSIYYSPEAIRYIPRLLQSITLSMLVLGCIASLFIKPKVNFVENNWSNWGEKVKGLLSNSFKSTDDLKSPSERKFQKINDTRSPRLLFIITVFYFTFCGFLFYSYKVIGFSYDYSDAAMSFVGGVDMLVLNFGKVLGVITYRKIGVKTGMIFAILVQGVFGMLFYSFNENEEIFIGSFFIIMLLHGFGFSLLIEEASQKVCRVEAALVGGLVILGYAFSNIVSSMIQKITIAWEVNESLYLILISPLLLALLITVCYARTPKN